MTVAELRGPRRGAPVARTSTRASRSTSAARSGRSRSTSCRGSSSGRLDAPSSAASSSGSGRSRRSSTDVYDAGQVFADGVMPARGGHHLVALPPGRGRDRPAANGVRVHVSGIDLIRDDEGEFRVLEDNVRVPSGVSYVMTNRRAMSSALPEVFAEHRIRPVSRLPAPAAGRAARGGAGRGRGPDGRRADPGRLQRRLLRARAARPDDGRRAGRGPRPGVPPRPGDDADHQRSGAGARHLPPGRRRVPRPGALPRRLAARLPRPDRTRPAPAT